MKGEKIRTRSKFKRTHSLKAAQRQPKERARKEELNPNQSGVVRDALLRKPYEQR